MEDAQRRSENVKAFLGMMSKQAQGQLRLSPQQVQAILQGGQQKEGSWLGTLAKLGLLGGLGYGAYRYLRSRQGDGEGADMGEVASRATDAERLLQREGNFWSGEQTLPSYMAPNVRQLAKDIIGRGGDVQDVINTVRQRHENYGLGDRSALPFRTNPLFWDPVDNIQWATRKLQNTPYGDPQSYVDRAKR